MLTAVFLIDPDAQQDATSAGYNIYRIYKDIFLVMVAVQLLSSSALGKGNLTVECIWRPSWSTNCQLSPIWNEPSWPFRNDFRRGEDDKKKCLLIRLPTVFNHGYYRICHFQSYICIDEIYLVFLHSSFKKTIQNNYKQNVIIYMPYTSIYNSQPNLGTAAGRMPGVCSMPGSKVRQLGKGSRNALKSGAPLAFNRGYPGSLWLDGVSIQHERMVLQTRFDYAAG